MRPDTTRRNRRRILRERYDRNGSLFSVCESDLNEYQDPAPARLDAAPKVDVDYWVMLTEAG
jgi:hypothetical protein